MALRNSAMNRFAFMFIRDMYYIGIDMDNKKNKLLLKIHVCNVRNDSHEKNACTIDG